MPTVDQVTSSHFLSQIQHFPIILKNIEVFIFWWYQICLWTKKYTIFERTKALFDVCCSGKPEATLGESREAAETRSTYDYCSTAHQTCLRSQVTLQQRCLPVATRALTLENMLSMKLQEQISWAVGETKPVRIERRKWAQKTWEFDPFRSNAVFAMPALPSTLSFHGGTKIKHFSKQH